MSPAFRHTYSFKEGNAQQRDILGGKGANLAEMTRLGLPVPPGFTISAKTCIAYYSEGKRMPVGLEDEIRARMKDLEAETGKKFGDPKNPLLVSVRSGAVVSMPGMMDTVLNLGLNDTTVDGLAALTDDERFAYDCYRRFIQMFSNVVLRFDTSLFERVMEDTKAKAGVHYDNELGPDHLKSIVAQYKTLVREKTGKGFPTDPEGQLMLSVGAVFESWNNQRAIVYRRVNKIPDDLGTAVNIQSMVFGNMGSDSATGVLFTRDPNTGEKMVYGEYLTNAQGEDVVSGIRTPKHIGDMATEFPRIHAEIVELCDLLENHYKDMQDIEFTMERGKLYVLQTRAGKRGARASVKIAVDMVAEGKIGKEEAILRVEPEQLERLMHRGIDPKAKLIVLAKGLPASPGAATGEIIFDSEAAEKIPAGKKVILVRPETSPDDMPGIVRAQGILTSRGGMTCHAAIVARHMGKPAIVGCEALRIDLDKRTVAIAGRIFAEGATLSIDGATGQVIEGPVPLVDPEIGGDFKEILDWADEVKRLGVQANADTPGDAQKARDFGAQGIGLCRTEHMFMQKERLPIVQEMIMAETEEERRVALDKLLPIQKEDFVGILKAMHGFPVTIRLLDPPLHEFLPDMEALTDEIRELRRSGPSKELHEKEDLLRKAKQLHESNPMMGFRGCRLGVIYPEIYEMQIRAILGAAVECIRAGVTDIKAEIMIPIVGIAEELRLMRELVLKVDAEIERTEGIKLSYKVGTMIEVPRAAVTADEIAEYAEFFSFGTNDLTQMTYGFSRDDAEGRFLKDYIEKKVLKENPFQVLDPTGVGKLIKMAVELGRRTRPDLKIGICGEHGGDPQSIAFCHEANLTYVSCSPFRVPVARLAAAHAALKDRLDIFKDK